MKNNTLSQQTGLPSNKWKNADNADFYNHFSLEAFKELAIKGGLDTCCDVEVVKNLCKSALNILEVGPGYGRVCECLLNMGIEGKLHVVERNAKFCEILREKYGKTIQIFEKDILDFENSLKFNVILMMWTGEIAKKELPIFLSKLHSLLSDKSVLVMDIVAKERKPLESIKISEENYCFPIENAKLYGYFFDANEIVSIAKEAGFKRVEHHAYKTTTGRPRVSHWFFN